MQVLKKLAKSKALLTVAAAFVMGVAFVPSIALADEAQDTFGIGYASATSLGDRDVRVTISSIINVALSLLGIVALVIILAGGFKWMTAGGNDEKVTEARKLMISGVIGLAIILSAYAIAKFVLQQLSRATASGDAGDAGIEATGTAVEADLAG
ncbi:MAG: hypothetical protein COV59_04555 [Candidatus Magasanikbacteria bacterium CG11_big_fil_rev_8_21_14_0_20_39_34]|uniref:Uncharacterized protein n=1 Tax=Candidatus Magasanikbacteria bacterium CG11_big_fil_rev_8_21_14_0_20_39_34 TaxID=1974653 RepID=A0A2H0N495_9BACT|nr:MAG: hypothetical protein COV59_04555 [Candidatus Magasanikbacteria bacterium CG11_big_fil_rev_8_21_14_0_20_39_34]